MPAEAAASSNAEPAASPARPYAPSWLHELLQALDRPPGPAWAWYAVLGLAVGVVYHVQFWTMGLSPFGQIDAENTFWGVALFAALWTSAHIERVASAAVDATLPALRLSASDIVQTLLSRVLFA